MRLEIVFAALAVCVAPSAHAQAERTYFLVDASDSMDDPSINGSIPKTYADEILQRELLKLVTPSSRANASINFFRANAKQCSAGTGKVGPQIPIPDPLPKSPKSIGATNLGATFEAALNDAAGHEARIVIITDGEQSDNCGFHICTVAGERLPALQGVSIEQYWALAGQEASVPFPCIQDALQARDPISSNEGSSPGKDKQEKASTTAVDQSVVATPELGEPLVDLTERFYWVFLLLLAPVAALQLSKHYSKSTDLVNDLNEEAKNYDDDALEKLAQSIRVDRTDSKYLKSDGDSSEQACGLVLGLISAFGFLIMFVSDSSYFVGAKNDFWRTMNSNFLSEGFAATVLVLAAFTAAQWWSRRRALKEVRITIGDVRRDRHSQLHTDLVAVRNRLSNMISDLQSADLWIAKPKAWQRTKNEAIADVFHFTKLNLIQRALKNKEFASNYPVGSIPRLREEKMHYEDELMRLSRYQNLRDANRFAEMLVEDGARLSRTEAHLLEQASLSAFLGRVEELRESLSLLHQEAEKASAT